MKRCHKCQSTKPFAGFAKDIKRKHGLQSTCRSCVAFIQKLRRYKLSQFEYNRIADEQGWVCAICKEVDPAVVKGGQYFLVVDHDHATDGVRGLLCNRCNRAIGLFEDRVDLLDLAGQYLSRPLSRKVA